MATKPRVHRVYIAKADRYMEVNMGDLSDQGAEYVEHYGLKQSLNDAGSEFTAEKNPDDLAEKAWEAAEKRLEKIVEGTITQREGGKRLDPVFKEARTILTKALVEAGMKASEVPAMKGWEDFEKVAKKVKAPIDAIKKRAEEIVATREGDGEIKVTL